MLLQVLKEQLVRSFDTDRDILDSMSRKNIPKDISRLLFEFREMFLQSIYRRTLMEYPIIALMQGNTVIVDDTCNVYLLIQIFMRCMKY